MTDTQTPAVESAPAPAPIARIVGGPTRRKSVTLDWPVEYDGVTYTEISVGRMTVAEVQMFMDRLTEVQKSDASATVRFPMFQDAGGQRIPDAVLDALDADDEQRLNEAALDFLPRRFRTSAEPVSTPETSANIDNSSGT